MVELNELALQHVLIMHRHGDRTPVLTAIGETKCMTDEEKDFWDSTIAAGQQLAHITSIAKVVGADSALSPYAAALQGANWPCGQLTQKGLDQMRERGRLLGQKYADFLAKHSASPDQVYVESTNIRRTILSTQSLLYGMFLEDKQHDTTSSQDNQKPGPVALFHVHVNEHNALAPHHPIELFNNLEVELADEVAQRQDDRICELADKVRQAYKIAPNVTMPWTAVRDNLVCRKAHDLPLPEGIDDQVYQQIIDYEAWLLHRLYARKKFNLDAFKGGVQSLYHRLKSATKDDHPHRLTVFSAHDNSIIALANALGMQLHNALPHYGAVLAFELYQHPTTQHYFVRVIFEDNEVNFVGREQANNPLVPFQEFEAIILEYLGDQET